VRAPARVSAGNGVGGYGLIKSHKCEFEIPPHTKVRVVATVEKRLCGEMELIHELEVKRACAEDRCEPDWSNTIEMLLRKGVKTYKQAITGK
jgi:hypothetical protein